MKKGRIAVFFIIVLALGTLIGFTYKDTASGIRLGLDLQGGFEVLYEVQPAKEGQVINDETMDATVSALNNRINVIGVSEPNIQIEGENRIRVQLAGVEDQNEARELLSTQAELTFRDVDDNLMLDGSDLEENGASLTFSETNQPWVALTLKDADKFAEVTKKISEKPPGENLLVIWLDYEEGDSFKEEVTKPDPKFLSAPAVNDVLNTKDVVIEGNFTVEEAKNLADMLNAGSLPVHLKEIYSTSVGAQFGQQALENTIFAGFIAVMLIFLFMIVYYRFLGLIATITLSVYIYLILVVFEWMNAVLTLPGIAALILGVGMAVDANILTYERIKEEIKAGKSIMSAFKAGGRRAFSSILDANLTTLIAAGVLFAFGTSAVKGFAVMLITSILVSFLTAVYGSRLLLGLWVNSRIFNKKPAYFGVKRSEIADLSKGEKHDIRVRFDFVKHRNQFFAASLVLIVLGGIVLGVFGLNLGTDFKSGTRVEVTGGGTKEADTVEALFEAIGLDPSEITFAGDNGEIAVVRLNEVLSQEKIAEVKMTLAEEYGAEPNVSTVSPQVGRELVKNAVKALLIAFIGIIIYVAIRFEWLQGAAAIVALLHDVFFIIAVFSLLRLEVNITFVAAVLTIVGYSINDTIVTFDRIRENLRLEKKVRTFDDIASIVNKSLQQTLARSINTVLTVVFAAAALTLLGGEAIFTFSIALLIGLAAGTYSSLFIASQLWAVWKYKLIQRKRAKPADA